ncbi:hypothetical protein [Dankookia sp. P2]|uniref:hypothetical protein n=1 Tax=Dankookia sp. P2 TaxID=3423955 RepID=UPI003D670350
MRKLVSRIHTLRPDAEEPHRHAEGARREGRARRRDPVLRPRRLLPDLVRRPPRRGGGPARGRGRGGDV